MKKMMMLIFVAALAIQGCTREARENVEEVGHDLKRDINNTVEDATD